MQVVVFFVFLVQNYIIRVKKVPNIHAKPAHEIVVSILALCYNVFFFRHQQIHQFTQFYFKWTVV